MLNLYRRHLESCHHRARSAKKCACPIWVQGTLRGEIIRKSLDLQNWETAQKLIRDWEAGVKEQEVVLVPEACDRFWADCVARRLSDASLRKYALLTKELKAEFHCPVGSLSLDDLRAYREKWNVAPITARKKLERLRTFFRFCNESGWIGSNPAKLLKMPQGRGNVAVPFSNSGMEHIIWATEVYPDTPHGRRNQIHAFVLLLRYSGLRIGDAVSLRRESVKDGRIFLRTAKTGTAVYLPLPNKAVMSLSGMPKVNEYFFWSGLNLRSAVSNWQRSLQSLFKLAGVRGHAHMFRHTFSVDLLSNGVPIEDVAILLGHSSSAITARHYNSFVKSRQQSLEASIQRAWKLK
jgi:integrase/recombinase XerD